MNSAKTVGQKVGVRDRRAPWSKSGGLGPSGLIGVYAYANTIIIFFIELTENVDVAICKYISVCVAGVALYHHQVILSIAVVFAQCSYCQSLLIAGEQEFG